MQDVRTIKNYILFLKREHGLSITLHPLRFTPVFASRDLLAFNIHSTSHCIYMKTCKGAQEHCIERQPRILERVKDGAFVGTCYAGVREFVYPMSDGEQVIGFISVSGYRCEGAESYLERTADRFGIPLSELHESYASLKSEMPSREEMDAMLLPLCDMIELAHRKSCDTMGEGESSLAMRIERYLKRHHNRDISSKEICDHFGCSRSFMSTQFNRHIGTSLREYINLLRVEDAKILLCYSHLNVTEIAYSVGFSDSNYFSSVFKKLVGESPLAYRRAFCASPREAQRNLSRARL